MHELFQPSPLRIQPLSIIEAGDARFSNTVSTLIRLRSKWRTLFDDPGSFQSVEVANLPSFTPLEGNLEPYRHPSLSYFWWEFANNLWGNW